MYLDVVPAYDSPYVQVPLELLEFKREVDQKNADAAKAIFDKLTGPAALS